MTQISNPLMYLADPTTSRALFNANLYFGVVDTDPTDPSNQKLVKAVLENGSLVSLSQPVATNQGGNPTYNGKPVVLDISGDYSFTVHNNLNAPKLYVPSVENPEGGSAGFSGVVAIEPLPLLAGQTTVILVNLGANESVFYLQSTIGDQGFLAKDIDYTVTNSTTIELTQSYNAGDTIIARQNDPSGQLLPINNAEQLLVYPILSDAAASAVSGDLVAGDTVTLNGMLAEGDGLGGDKYLVQVTGPSNDGVNYIDLNTTLQLAAQTNHYRFLNYSETLGTASVTSGTLTVDINNGTVQQVTLSENISSFVIVNFNPNAAYVTTVSVKISQDGTGSRSLAWPGNIIWPSGSAPTLTATALASDFFGFTTLDGGVTWIGSTYGQDYS